ncbi:hypothetical protein C5167_010809 [Papaver somniferum]|uniref:Protein kinase domain-containing protein n=1 Tax=Papaver somniferum TaxID=3469 RepID=A0A4Y7K4F0_PAPSO|nr:hypothetical protein C5167_010809 [Papaver somniferum]
MKFIGAAVEPELVIVIEIMRGDSLQNYLRNMRPRRPELRQSISFRHLSGNGMHTFKWHHPLYKDMDVAVKMIEKDITASSERSDRFLREVMMLSRVEHDNLVKLLLTEDCMKLKLAGIGMAREKEAGEMMTCEASTYKWMAPEVCIWSDYTGLLLLNVYHVKNPTTAVLSPFYFDIPH